jgi:hypothetical protein
MWKKIMIGTEKEQIKWIAKNVEKYEVIYIHESFCLFIKERR